LKVLDLYAGSGALGIEALSRGATHASFVDNDQEALRCIKKNLETLGFSDCGELHPQDAINYVARARGFDLIFADPPYDPGPHAILERISRVEGLIVESGRLVIEHRRATLVPEALGNLRQFLQRRYGESMLSFFEVGGLS